MANGLGQPLSVSMGGGADDEGGTTDVWVRWRSDNARLTFHDSIWLQPDVLAWPALDQSYVPPTWLANAVETLRESSSSAPGCRGGRRLAELPPKMLDVSTGRPPDST
jgi:hypothetical protein